MSIGLLFWILMIFWGIFGVAPEPQGWSHWRRIGNGLLFILFFLVGWKIFGFVIHE